MQYNIASVGTFFYAFRAYLESAESSIQTLVFTQGFSVLGVGLSRWLS